MPTFVIGKPIEVHPLLAEQTIARDFWRRSDKARWDYAKGVDAQSYPILPIHEREPQDRFQRRQRQSLVRRYARPIIDRYNDFVMREEAKRPEVAGPYAEFQKDSDGVGTSLTDLMRMSLRKAQVDGLSYQLVDANDPSTYLSVAAETAAGKRGIVRLIDPDDVIWWRDWQGVVVEAVIVCIDREGKHFAWYVTETTSQRIDIKLGQDKRRWIITGIGPITPQSYGGCPLVRMVPIADGDCPGEDSQCAPLAEGQKRICNIDSWLMEELQSCTFTTTVFLGVSADSVKEAIAGPGMVVCLPQQSGGTSNPAIGKIGSDVSQAASIRDSLAYEIRELYRVAGLSPGNPTEAAQPESGVAKAFAFNEISAKCSAMADAVEKTENRVVYLLSKGFGWTYPGDADYPDTFEDPDLGAELALAIQMQTAGLPPVLQRAQVERIAASGFELTGPEQAQLKTELDAKASQDAKAKESSIVNPPAFGTRAT